MTKKDYILLADTLLHTKPVFLSDDYAQWRADVLAIEDTLAQENGRFNPSKFLTACGLTDSER